MRLGAALARFVAAVCVAAPASAWAGIVTYDVDLNYDPTKEDGGTGKGTVMGTFAVNNKAWTITSVDLTEKTNDPGYTIGGAFGSPTYTSFTFDEPSQARVTYELGGGSKFGGSPYLFVFFGTDVSYVDGVNVGPYIQFDFAYPGGGAVEPGNFDLINSETRYLYGNVTVSGVPEPSTWLLMGIGFAAVGFAGYRASRRSPTVAA